MICIRINTIPPGEAPLRFRKGWLGCVIPLDDPFGPYLPPGLGIGIESGKPCDWGGFLVNAKIAIETMAEERPRLAQKWFARYPRYWEDPVPHFVFDETCCEIIFLENKLAEGEVSFSQLLECWQATSNHLLLLLPCFEWLKTPFPSEKWWTDIQGYSLNAKIVAQFSYRIIQAMRYSIFTSYEQLSPNDDELGEKIVDLTNQMHGLMRELHTVATKDFGLNLEIWQVDGPISPVEVGISVGLVQVDPDGNLTLDETLHEFMRKMLGQRRKFFSSN